MIQASKTLLLIIFSLLLTSCSMQKHDNTKITEKQTNNDYSVDSQLFEASNIEYRNSILLLLPLSGSNKKIGTGILNACLLSVKQNWNENIKVYVVDTADKKVEKGRLHEKFKEHNLLAIVGPVFFNETKQYGALFPNTPIFTFSNNLQANNNHIFTCGLSPQDEIFKFFSKTKSQKIDDLLVLLPNGNYGDEILKYITLAAKRFNFEDIEVVRYKSITRNNAMKCVENSGKKAVFIVDSILDIEKLDDIKVVTLSSQVISDPERWKGALFVFVEDNDEMDNFKEKYKKLFVLSPNVLDIIGYDVMNAVFQSVSEGEVDGDVDFEQKYNGCLGQFVFRKNKGLKRRLNLFQQM